MITYKAQMNNIVVGLEDEKITYFRKLKDKR